MIRFLRHYFRSLSKRKLLSIIAIGGFSISISVILLLAIFIAGEKNVNRSFPNAEDIYRLKRGEQTLMPEKLLEDVKQGIPGVKDLCVYSIHDNLLQIDKTKTYVKCLATNDAFLKMFSLDFTYHSPDLTLEVEDNIIITQSFRNKWFGDKNPIGEIIKGYKNYKVVGVIKDFENSSINFDVIFGLKNGYAHYVGSKEDNVSHKLFNSFIQLQKDVIPETVGSQISTAINKWALFKNDKVSLQPLSEVYFDLSSSGDHLSHANVSMLYLLSSIAALILIITIFNYVNLTVSSGYQRLKEVGIRKTIGAASQNIFLQFLYEGLLATLLSFLLASLFATVLAPVLSGILGKEISIASLISIPEVWLIIFMVFFISGIVSGIFPAILFSRYSPLQMVSNKLNFGKNTIKGGVVAVQFVIVIALIASVFFIEKQINFIKNRDLGFDKESIVRLKLDGDALIKSEILKDKLLKNPNITKVSGSSGSIMDFRGSGTEQIEVNGKTQLVDLRMIGIDDDFVDLFGLELIRGNNNNTNNRLTCFINERYYNSLGWDDFTGKKIFHDDFEVTGIVKDFNFDNLHKDIGFIILYKGTSPDIFNIEIKGNISENIAFIKKCYAEVEPYSEADYAFYDDYIQGMYDKEEKQAKAVRIFALFAIIISCLGLIGLTELTTNKKIKEIGIRKVNGAKISEILTMLNKDFVIWVAIAFVVATPIAYYAMSKWLENFAYKTELSWWIFALAGLFALGIALLTVSWQSWRAATRNPVEALRYE